MPHVVSRPKGDDFKKVKCKNCRCKIAYLPKDIESRHGTDYGGGPDGETYVRCPECNERIILTCW